MCTTAQLKHITEIMANAYREVYGANIMTIYLYGSYARGDYDGESDVDLVAIVKGERTVLQDKLKKVWDISVDVGFEHDVVISPMVIPYSEFEEYREKLPYYRNIEREGLKIG